MKFFIFFISLPLSFAQTTVQESTRLTQLIQNYVDAVKNLDSYYAPYWPGLEEKYAEFGDGMSEELYAKSKALSLKTSQALKNIDSKKLQGQDLISYTLFKPMIEESLAADKYDTRALEFTQNGNRLQAFMLDAGENEGSFPFTKQSHFEAFIKRSAGLSAFVDNLIHVLRHGIKQGYVLPCSLLQKTRNTYTEALEENPEKNPFFAPTQRFSKDISKKDAAKLRDGFREMIQKNILPNYKRFDDFFVKEYSLRCRKTYGLNSLAHGKELYAQSIRSQTDTKFTAEDLHQRGLSEVARIEKEIVQVQKQLGYSGNYSQFMQKIESDSSLYFKTPSETRAAFEAVEKKVLTLVDTYFSQKPKSGFSIVEAASGDATGAAYAQPTEAMPFGRFILNTKNPKATSRYEVTTLFLHEAIPGHHFQLSLAFEMKDSLSEFRRQLFDSTAFVEGWALYTETLGNEMGLYADPWQKLGNLNYEMLRAVRLVVDTGIHSQGWSREKVLSYMQAHLVQDPKDRESEADRYAANPGQALAYKVGQMKILELRTQAQKTLGKKFDIKEFHKVVIGSGTISLEVLDMLVQQWIKIRAAAP